MIYSSEICEITKYANLKSDTFTDNLIVLSTEKYFIFINPLLWGGIKW